MVLGNAYLSLFLMTNHDPKLLKQCVSAYNHAVSTTPFLTPLFVILAILINSLIFYPQEKDSVTANNPDLHFNRATVSVNYEASSFEFTLSSLSPLPTF